MNDFANIAERRQKPLGDGKLAGQHSGTWRPAHDSRALFSTPTSRRRPDAHSDISRPEKGYQLSPRRPLHWIVGVFLTGDGALVLTQSRKLTSQSLVRVSKADLLSSQTIALTYS